jgi:hypothetical protein
MRFSHHKSKTGGRTKFIVHFSTKLIYQTEQHIYPNKSKRKILYYCVDSENIYCVFQKTLEKYKMYFEHMQNVYYFNLYYGIIHNPAICYAWYDVNTYYSNVYRPHYVYVDRILKKIDYKLMKKIMRPLFEELVARVFHPDRLCCISKEYNIDVCELVEMY